MSGQTSIEWTDRTWNPLTGCTKVSPGCDHCYAKTMHERFHGTGSFDTVTLHPERLDQPLRWCKPSRVFVNSMSDLFHQDVPDEYIAQMFAVMALAPKHTFQLLTKRHARMRSLLNDGGFQMLVWTEMVERDENFEPVDWPLPNVWLGVSVETQQWAEIRIPALLDTPAAVRFLSCEPLLGPVTFRWAKWQPFSDEPGGVTDHLDGLRRIDWVIVGGESGPGARPMHPDWARTIRDQCVAADVPFLFKQWGSWRPIRRELVAGRRWRTQPLDEKCVLVQMGKHDAGRELDGRTWDEYPGEARRHNA